MQVDSWQVHYEASAGIKLDSWAVRSRSAWQVGKSPLWDHATENKGDEPKTKYRSVIQHLREAHTDLRHIIGFYGDKKVFYGDKMISYDEMLVSYRV